MALSIFFAPPTPNMRRLHSDRPAPAQLYEERRSLPEQATQADAASQVVLLRGPGQAHGFLPCARRAGACDRSAGAVADGRYELLGICRRATCLWGPIW